MTSQPHVLPAVPRPREDDPTAAPRATERPRRRSAAEEDRLVREHLPLVGYLVSETIARLPDHVQREDLVAAGMVALAQAARGWDQREGVPFGRYASPRIKGAFIDELRSTDWASRGARARARRLEEAREQLTATMGRPPSDAELASALGVDVAEIGSSRGETQRAAVLSLQGLGDAGVAVDDVLPDRAPGPEDALLAAERRGYLREAVAALPERLRVVVEMSFFEERPLAEVAAAFGVTPSRVSQQRAEALLLLRGALQSALEPDRPAEAPAAGVAERRRQAYYAEVAARSTVHSRLASDEATRRTAGTGTNAAGTPATRTAAAQTVAAQAFGGRHSISA